ncbi:MAG: glycosyltransferase [Azoarcus sp.]|jgi:glycosyltransferase involved in cell wall biosynthesis|nr:glycosyltransferase [Azoarcus sp.]
MQGPHIGVLSSLFPSSVQPDAGLFIRERVLRVARRLPLFVVAPTPWFPLQNWVRQHWNRYWNWKHDFHSAVPEYEEQQGIPVWYPRFVSTHRLPRLLDGWTMAKGAYARFAVLRQAGRFDLIDAHGGYPEGCAALWLSRRLGVPFTVTLHDSAMESACARDLWLAPRMREALMHASHVIVDRESLHEIALGLGVVEERIEVVGDGVDAERFRPLERAAARVALDLPPDAPLLVSMGALLEEKGHRRVIEILPSLLQRWPGLVYLIVEAGNPVEGVRAGLAALIEQMKLGAAVCFLPASTLTPAKDRLPEILSAANVFVLATSREERPSVFLEAMACGLPIVTTDVGGNREIISRPELGELVPFGEPLELEAALDRALSRVWDRAAIRRCAETNHWDGRVGRLCRVFTESVGRTAR